MKPTTKSPRKMNVFTRKAALCGAVSVVGLMATTLPVSAQQIQVTGPSASIGGPQVQAQAPGAVSYGGAPLVGPGAQAPVVTASASRWNTTLVPFVEASVTYSDNIGLDPSGLEESDTVFTVGAGATYGIESARLSGQIGYSLSYDKYLDRDENDGFRHQLNTAWNATVVPNLFYVDVAGGISEVFVDSDDRFSGNPLAAPDDRSRAYYGMISPSLRKNIGGWGVAELRYGLQGNFYEDSSIDDSYSHSFRAQLASNPNTFRNFGWTVGADYQIVNRDGDDGVDRDRWSSYATVDVPVSRTMALTAAVGYDQVGSSIDNDLGGLYGNVGVRVQPNARMQAEAHGGWRYGGADYGVNLNYAVRDNLTAGLAMGRSVQYSVFEDTLSNVELEGAGYNSVNAAIQNNLVSGEGTGLLGTNFNLANQDNIADNIGAYISGVGNRSSYSLGVQAQRRDYGSLFNDETVLAADVGFTRELTDRMSLDLGAGYSQFDLAGSTDQDFKTLSFGTGLNYQVTEIVNVFGRYTYTQRLADDAANEFTENAGTLGLSASF